MTVRLAIMMFLQFFIWGSWFNSISLYLLEHDMANAITNTYASGPLAAMIMPVFMGLLVDRFFNTEKVCAVLFILSGIFMSMLPSFSSGEQDSRSFTTIVLLHMLCFMPTLSLTASLSFHHLKKAASHFPRVRVFGTIGWIVASALISYFNAERSEFQLYMGATASILLGLYCLTFPKTPAPKKDQKVNIKDLLFWDAWSQFKTLSFAVFIIGSFLICIPLAAYYVSLQQQLDAMKVDNIAFVKSFGQYTEVAFMILMPYLFVRLGVKKIILLGVLAWVIRYALFALGASPEGFYFVCAGILLHGVCYDFFFVAGQVYVDNETPSEVRGQAQGLLVFFTQGLGLFVGFKVIGWLTHRAFGESGISNLPENLAMWKDVWWPLAGLAALIMLVFALLFRPRVNVVAPKV